MVLHLGRLPPYVNRVDYVKMTNTPTFYCYTVAVMTTKRFHFVALIQNFFFILC